MYKRPKLDELSVWNEEGKLIGPQELIHFFDPADQPTMHYYIRVVEYELLTSVNPRVPRTQQEDRLDTVRQQIKSTFPDAPGPLESLTRYIERRYDQIYLNFLELQVVPEASWPYDDDDYNKTDPEDNDEQGDTSSDAYESSPDGPWDTIAIHEKYDENDQSVEEKDTRKATKKRRFRDDDDNDDDNDNDNGDNKGGQFVEEGNSWKSRTKEISAKDSSKASNSAAAGPSAPALNKSGKTARKSTGKRAPRPSMRLLKARRNQE
ncbi:hypothetical protein C8J56DRAFT_1050774 [Mycena floridula]|nr:hypothetical protein C8J56DRAFT_1050774 [Mycena floridula]